MKPQLNIHLLTWLYNDCLNLYGAFIGKCDIKSEFKLICLRDFDQLHFMFEDIYYIDKCLQMGRSASCKVL